MERPHLYVVEQSPMGTHDFPEMPEVNITGGLDGMRLWLRGSVFFSGSATACLKLKTALDTLDAYGLLSFVRTPQDVVREMLAASLADGGDAA